MYTVNNTYINVFYYCTYELIKAAGSACTYYNFIISFLWCCVLCPPGTLPVITCRQLALLFANHFYSFALKFYKDCERGNFVYFGYNYVCTYVYNVVFVYIEH